MSAAISLPAPHTWQQQRAEWWRFLQKCLSWSFPGTASSVLFLGRTWPSQATLHTQKQKHTWSCSGFCTDLLQHFLGCKELWSMSILTNSVLWWQVYSVSVEILQEGSVHQVWELMNFYSILVRFIQQCSEMLTPIEKDSRRLVTKARLTQTNLINGRSHFIMCRWQNIVLCQQETALPNEKKEISKKLN